MLETPACLVPLVPLAPAMCCGFRPVFCAADPSLVREFPSLPVLPTIIPLQ